MNLSEDDPTSMLFRSYVSSAQRLDIDLTSCKRNINYIEDYIKTQSCINVSKGYILCRDSLNVLDSSKCHNAIYQRYIEVKEQLAIQRKLLGHDSGSSADERKVPKFISFPEHFGRRDVTRTRERGVFPWEGSDYIISLLSSLSEKLLLKYCFLQIKSRARQSKLLVAAVAEGVQLRSESLLRTAFYAFKLQFLHSLHDHLSQAKAIGFRTKSSLTSSITLWTSRVQLVRKHSVMAEIVREWREVNAVRACLRALRSLHRRGQTSMKAYRKQLVITRKERCLALRDMVTRAVGRGTGGEISVRDIRRKQKQKQRVPDNQQSVSFWSRCEGEAEELRDSMELAEVSLPRRR